MATLETVRDTTALFALPDPDATTLRRRELGAFLRSRRERLKPEQVGLRSMRRRRTPGLRREEVAQLAGVGVTWYTWLEQGREINPSAQVLDAIARTLQFDVHEHIPPVHARRHRDDRRSRTSVRRSVRPCSR